MHLHLGPFNNNLHGTQWRQLKFAMMGGWEILCWTGLNLCRNINHFYGWSLCFQRAFPVYHAFFNGTAYMWYFKPYSSGFRDIFFKSSWKLTPSVYHTLPKGPATKKLLMNKINTIYTILKGIKIWKILHNLFQ